MTAVPAPDDDVRIGVHVTDSEVRHTSYAFILRPSDATDTLPYDIPDTDNVTTDRTTRLHIGPEWIIPEGSYTIGAPLELTVTVTDVNG